MVNLAPPPASWVDVIKGAAEEFMTARVCFFDESGDGDYDPITGEGDESTIRLIWAGIARVQHLRSAQRFATDYQAEANRPFRFQLPKDSDVPFLPQGTSARVLDAGDEGDHNLESLVYVVDSAINASFQAVKTVELTSTMSPIEWDWDEGTLYAPATTAESTADGVVVTSTPRGWNVPEAFVIEVGGAIDPNPILGTQTTVVGLPAGEYQIRTAGVFNGEYTPWSKYVTVEVA